MNGPLGGQLDSSTSDRLMAVTFRWPGPAGLVNLCAANTDEGIRARTSRSRAVSRSSRAVRAGAGKQLRDHLRVTTSKSMASPRPRTLPSFEKL